MDDAHLVAPPDFEVSVLALLDLAVDALDLEGVLLRLGLEVFDLDDHLLQLLASLFKRLLVKHQFLSDFRPTLFGQDVLQLDVQFFFFLYQNVLLANLLCLSNEALLQRLNFLNEFKSFNISGL